MRPLSHLQPLPFSSVSSNAQLHMTRFHFKRSKFILLCSSTQPNSATEAGLASGPDSKPGLLDNLFLNLFRKKMVEEIGWDSKKPGYDGLIEVANRLMVGRTNSETNEAAVRILRSLFPPFLLELYRMLITPIGGGRLAAMMVARVTALTCPWLMGPCMVNSINHPDGSSCKSGVFVERCKYLVESKCMGICVNTCKLPTQTFFKDYMGIPLLMEPNFSDYSCQIGFHVLTFEDPSLATASSLGTPLSPRSARNNQLFLAHPWKQNVDPWLPLAANYLGSVISYLICGYHTLTPLTSTTTIKLFCTYPPILFFMNEPSTLS